MRKLNVTILVGVLVALLGFGLVFAYGSNVDAAWPTARRPARSSSPRRCCWPAPRPATSRARWPPRRCRRPTSPTACSAISRRSQARCCSGPVGKGSQLTKAMFGQPLEAGDVKPSRATSRSPSASSSAQAWRATSRRDRRSTSSRPTRPAPPPRPPERGQPARARRRSAPSCSSAASGSCRSASARRRSGSRGHRDHAAAIELEQVVAVLDVTPAGRREDRQRDDPRDDLLRAVQRRRARAATTGRRQGATPDDVVVSNR